MKKIITIGELLIDFIPHEKGLALKDVSNFKKAAGGAPANVAVAASKLGSDTLFLGQVGNDAFGDFLVDVLKKENVGTSYLTRSSAANTALAFVSLTHEGERDFIFYRNPSADQLYTASTFHLEELDDSILHFCSVSLLGYTIQETHTYLLEEAKRRNTLISFDPNVRKALAGDLSEYQRIIRDYLHYADVLKVSDDELEFITGLTDEREQIDFLLHSGCKLLILTKGSRGVSVYTKQLHLFVPGFSVQVKDTTGAGDAWIGSFLHHISKHAQISDLEESDIKYAMAFSNAFAALTTTKLGAMDAMPSREETLDFMKKTVAH